MKKFTLAAISTMAVLLLWFPSTGWGQTNPATGSLPYSFTGATTIPSTIAIHRFGTSAAAIPTSRITTDGTGDLPVTTTNNSGGYMIEGTGGADGVSLLASSSQSAGAIIIEVSTIGKTGISVSWVSWTKLDQTTYTCSMALQYRAGESGTWINVDNPTSSVYSTNATIGRSNFTNFSQTLPAGAENQAIIQVRWIYWISGGTSGSRDRLGIDEINISSTAVAPTWTSGWPKAEDATPSGFTSKVNISAAGTSYFVALPNGAAAPSSAQVKAGQDASGTAVASNLAGTINCLAANTQYTSTVTGLSSSTTYDVYFVAEASSMLQASPVKVSVTTGSSASAPSISALTVTGITDNSATLGANITSDGGSALTERGTIWKTGSGVTIYDNKLALSGPTTGVFTHTRTSLPAKTQIFYNAFATNSVNTTLVTPESSFFTLAVEPPAHVGSFTATTTGPASINLTWSAVSGADGYLILKKQASTAPTGVPSDATGYTTGNTIGDATVAADVTSGSATSQSISGLSASTQYYFTILPYAYDGLNYQTYNYNTTATIPSATATTQDLVTYWDGGASTTAWTDANNWSGNVVPSSTDIVVLDNSLVSSSYSVDLPSGNVKTTIRRLSITPSTSLAITVTLPTTNTYGASNDAGLVAGDNTSSTDDIIINNGGILINASGATAGNGIQVNALGNGTVRINNGGKFVHKCTRSTAGIIPLLSTATGTETGIFEYDVPGTSSFAMSASGRTFGSLVLSRSAGAATYTSTGGSATVVKGDFIINSGVTYSTTMSGGLNVAGNFTNYGVSYTTTTQLVTMNGTALQTISGLGTNNFSGGLTISNSAGVKLVDAATVSNLTVSSGLFTIASDASLITTGTVTGTSAVERHITPYAAQGDAMFHFLSSPVTAQPILPLFSDPANNSTDDFYKFDEPTYMWINYRDAAGTGINGSFGESNFVVGRGYLIAYAIDATKTFTGTLNTGTLTSGTGLPSMSFTSTLIPDNDGWNLMGNPYPSAIDWDNVTSGQYANLDNAVYVYDNATSTYLSNVSGFGALIGGIIPAMQGFFVHANAALPTLYLENQDRVHGGSAYYKSSPVENAIRLKVEGNQRYDETFIRFTEGATADFDGAFDAYKLEGGTSVPTFYSLAGEDKLSVNSLPISNMEGFVPLAVKAGAEASYSISLVENSLPLNTYVTLEDIKTGITQRLNNTPVYTFTAAPGEDPNRFRLHFKDATSVPDPSGAQEFTVYSNNGCISVNCTVPIDGKITVTDLAGRVISTERINSNKTLIDIKSYPGVYLIIINTAKSVYTQKVIVK
jgi:hypothetical protein